MKFLNFSYPILFLAVSIIILSCLCRATKQHKDSNCIHQCGNIEIPHPFGVSTETTSNHCFKDTNFEVSCNKSSSSSSNQSTPYLKKLGLEIVEVRQLSNEVIVKYPSVTACNGTEKHWSSPELSTKSSTFYVWRSNVFASVGCHGYAFFYGNGEETNTMIKGCTSVCSGEGSSYSNSTDQCYGFNNCCQVSVSKSLNYSITVSSQNGSGSEDCRSAFLISRDYLPNVSSTLPSMLSTFPVMLHYEWQRSNILGEICGTIITISMLCFGPVMTCYLIGQCWWCKTNKRRKETKLRKKHFKGRLEEQKLNKEESDKTKLFTEKELKKATNNFNENRVTGKGGQGTVYKGMLSDGKLIAVKRSSSLSESHWKEFINEVIILSHINHRNIVKLLGCCLETNILHLVYEFIPNGTLSELIHSPNEEFEVTWDIRLRIASEVAGAIAYLHASSSTPIYHRDIKSCNILLDQSYTAKVCDFGISRSISMDQTHLTTCVRGTFGYFDPQYFRTRQFTEKSDVYSFGVVLVEILTGQKPIGVTTSEHATSLVMQFMKTEDSALFEMLDPIILDSSDITEDIKVVVKLAKHCLNPEGALRPTMMQVAMELSSLSKKVYPNIAASSDGNASDLSQQFFSTKTQLDESCSF